MKIMVLNSKKCSTMRKFITTMLIAAAAFTACVQNDEVVVPNNNETVSVTVNLTNPDTRTVLVEEDGKFHAEWKAGDGITLYQVTDMASRDKVSTKIAEDGKTATVTVEFPKREGEKFYYVMASPVCSMSGTYYMAFDGISDKQAPAAMNTFDGASDFILSKAVELTSQPTETINFENERISAIAKISIKVPTLANGDAIKSVIFACEQPIAGKISYCYLTDILNNEPLKQHTHNPALNTITVTLPEAQTADFSYYMCLWPETLAKDDEVTVTLLTNNDKKYIKKITLPKDLEFKSGVMTGLTVNMTAIKEYNPIEMPDYVTVAGIKWAMGNLEYEVDGDTDTGFAAGWRIAPTQYHHFNIGATGDLELTNYNKVALFNYGGINKDGTGSFSSSGHTNELYDLYKLSLHLAGTGDITDISGKIFTDATCTTPATSWADAQYGDIAYWASKGEYRMPTAAEFEKLYTDACRTLATYNDGTNTIKGTYFYNPGAGESAGVVEGTKVLAEKDLAVGLFLPNSGRGYDTEEWNIYDPIGTGIYRTSTVHEQSDVNGLGYGVIYRIMKTSEGSYKSTVKRTKNNPVTFAYGACGRYAIRPVVNE